MVMQSEMTKLTINIMEANLSTLRYHGVWPTYVNGQEDKFYRIKLLLLACSMTFLWICAASHLTHILVGK